MHSTVKKSALIVGVFPLVLQCVSLLVLSAVSVLDCSVFGRFL